MGRCPRGSFGDSILPYRRIAPPVHTSDDNNLGFPDGVNQFIGKWPNHGSAISAGDDLILKRVLRDEKEIVLHSTRKTLGSNWTMLLKPCVGVSYVRINRRIDDKSECHP